MPGVRIRTSARQARLDLAFSNPGGESVAVTLGDDAYGFAQTRQVVVPAGGTTRAVWNAERSQDWYDFTITTAGVAIRAAGRIERGIDGVSDPLMATVA